MRERCERGREVGETVPGVDAVGARVRGRRLVGLFFLGEGEARGRRKWVREGEGEARGRRRG